MRNYCNHIFDIFTGLLAASPVVFPTIILILKIFCVSHRGKFGEKLTISTAICVLVCYISTGPKLNLNLNFTVGEMNFTGSRDVLFTEGKDKGEALLIWPFPSC